MKKVLLFFSALLLLFFFFEACLQFRPDEIPSLPSPVLEKSVLCARVDVQDEWADSIDEKVIFVKGEDKRIYSFLSFKNVKDEHFLEWKWYDPHNRVYRWSERIKIGKKGQYFEKYIAWDSIFLFEENVWKSIRPLTSCGLQYLLPF